VIEVNDNPNIDSGVEDQYLGDELYRLIMSEFLRRLEDRSKGLS
jgi:glutathione synthase/RimK-type ligase-like ATP-grasp enzyme